MGQQREEFGHPAFPDQMPLDAQMQRQGVEDTLVDRLGEGVGVVEESRVERGVAVGQRLDEEPQIAGEDVLVVTAPGVGPVDAAARVRTPLSGEEVAHRRHGGDPVPDPLGTARFAVIEPSLVRQW